MTVGELYDIIEDVRVQVVEDDPVTWEQTIVHDSGDEVMCERGLNKKIANATVNAVYSFTDGAQETILQICIWKCPSK